MRTKLRPYVLLGAEVQRLREALGLTKQTLAVRCAASLAFIHGIEIGRALPSHAALVRLAAALGADPAVLTKLGDQDAAEAHALGLRSHAVVRRVVSRPEPEPEPPAVVEVSAQQVHDRLMAEDPIYAELAALSGIS